MVQLLNIKYNLDEFSIKIIMAQIIQALFYLHSKGIIYGDLKAENILISKNGTIKLCDFNLSGTKSLLKDSLKGTLTSISPELLRQNKRTHKSDFWSLGVLCHFLFYRKYPFKSDNNSTLIKDIVNRNIIPEQRGRKASPQLRLFIEELLTLDYKKRLGNRMEDFKQHPFFNEFDWHGYFQDKNNFRYAMNYNQSESETSQLTIELDDSRDLTDNTNNSGNYKIQGFTYKHESNSNIYSK